MRSQGAPNLAFMYFSTLAQNGVNIEEAKPRRISFGDLGKLIGAAWEGAQ
jgi:hypothetical protein